MQIVTREKGIKDRALASQLRAWRHTLGLLGRKPLGATGLVILIIASLVAILASFLAPYHPEAIDREAVLVSPRATHWFGSDILGRDLFSRTLYGARVSLIVGLAAVVAGTTTGAVIGIISAYFGGKTDLILQRFVDSLSAFPALVLAIAIMAVLGQSLINVIIALSIVQIPRAARTLRSVALSIKETMYVEAARAIGCRDLRIMVQHVAPNCVAPYIIMGTAGLGTAIVAEASLSFLGIGTPAEVPSWGALLSGDQMQYLAVAPWLGVFPGLALTLVVFGINVLGDAMRDILDPRMRGRP